MESRVGGATAFAPIILALLCVLAVVGGANAQSGGSGIYGPGGGLSPLTVKLGCRIENEKVLVITNTSGNAMPPGTAISYDAARKPDGAHYGRIVRIGLTLAPGSTIRVGGMPSYSCTAWFRQALTNAPST